MTRRLVFAVIALIVVFMLTTLVIALGQDNFTWGWWWAVPLGGLFVLLIVGFRMLVQRSQEAAERADRADDPAR